MFPLFQVSKTVLFPVVLIALMLSFSSESVFYFQKSFEFPAQEKEGLKQIDTKLTLLDQEIQKDAGCLEAARQRKKTFYFQKSFEFPALYSSLPFVPLLTFQIAQSFFVPLG